jgi:hypothetical protein
MTAKKVPISQKPKAHKKTPDEWVKNRNESGDREPMKRLTIDVPESLHKRIKTSCAARGTKMADELRTLLEANYAG